MAPIGGVRAGYLSVGKDAIPDTSMFQSPIYQWAGSKIEQPDGTSPVDWPESLAELSDATAVGSPTYRQDQSGFEAVEYDPNDGDNDGHNFSPDSQLPTGSDAFSIAATVYFRSTSGDSITHWGTESTENENAFLANNNVLRHQFFGNDLTGSTLPTGQFITVGVKYDTSNRKLYLNGSGDGSDSPGSVNVSDSNHGLAYAAGFNDNYLDGYLHDVVISDVAEGDQAFADYHNDRLG